MHFWIWFLLLPISCFGKVYDCFPFFNELELLQIRLHELSDVVDYFVLVESIETQRGHPKKLYFTEHKEKFFPFLDRIIHVVIDERHPEMGLWERENFQRNAILRGLKHCKKNDIILISDVDEIPKKEWVPHIKEEMRRRSIDALTFQCRLHRFHLNRWDPNEPPWDGTVATIYKNVAKNSPQYYRNKRVKFWHFRDGGWHFTWVGGKQRYREKMTSVVEGKDFLEVDDESLERLFHMAPIIPLDDSFPRYILEHQEELLASGFLAEE